VLDLAMTLLLMLNCDDIDIDGQMPKENNVYQLA
jgi:hypothetical protein